MIIKRDFEKKNQKAGKFAQYVAGKKPNNKRKDYPTMALEIILYTTSVLFTPKYILNRIESLF